LIASLFLEYFPLESNEKMEPVMIAMVVEPQDFLIEIVKRRAAQLEGMYPEFRGEFEEY
jgi:hypothetical protein